MIAMIFKNEIFIYSNIYSFFFFFNGAIYTLFVNCFFSLVKFCTMDNIMQLIYIRKFYFFRF